MASSSLVKPTRPTGSLRLAFERAIQNWYYDLIPFALLNFLWMLLVLTVIGGPPATAALMAVARDSAMGCGAEPGNFFLYLRRFYWRAWKLGIITLLGSIILATDIGFYADALKGSALVRNTGILFLVYILIVWLECLLIAWPMLVDRPEMRVRDVIRNAVVLALHVPASALGLALLVLCLFVLSLALGVLVALAFGAVVSLIAQHYLHMHAPVLANFPPPPGEAPAHTAAPAPPDEK